MDLISFLKTIKEQVNQIIFNLGDYIVCFRKTTANSEKFQQTFPKIHSLNFSTYLLLIFFPKYIKGIEKGAVQFFMNRKVSILDNDEFAC